MEIYISLILGFVFAYIIIYIWDWQDQNKSYKEIVKEYWCYYG